MDYREHSVSDALRPIVDTIWTLEADAGVAAAEAQPVVPDGRAEIIVHFGDPFERVDAGVVTRQPAVLFAGQLDAALVLRPTGRVAVMGIRLRPAGASALVRAPQHTFVGLTEDLREISRPLARWLTDLCDAAPSPQAAAARVGDGLGRLTSVDRIDRRVDHAVTLIERGSGRLTVEHVAVAVGVTRRQLERLFREHVGLSPKRLMRIRRLQRALCVLDETGPVRAGVRAAFEGGFADQAHFVRECKAIAGYTPGAHVLQRAELTGLLLDRRQATSPADYVARR